MGEVSNLAGGDTFIGRLVQLTRWNDHVFFTLPATLLGVNLALARGGEALDRRAAMIVLANVLAVAFAFMVNDIEDAPDDRCDPNRRAHNVIAAGQLAPTVGWRAAWIVAAFSLIGFALVNASALAVGTITLLLGWLYSWRPVRLKALPLLDLLSHILMLSSLLVLAGYVAYADSVRGAWPVLLGVGLISAYGQLYNQLRDFDQDRAAGLRNTAFLLGRRGTCAAMYVALVAAAFSFLIALHTGLIPFEFVLLVVLLSPLTLLLRTAQDMRGTLALDVSGSLQTGAMLVATAATAIWLLAQTMW